MLGHEQKVVANQFIGGKLRNKVVTNKSLCTVCASTVYTIQPSSPLQLLPFFIYTLYTFWPLTSCCLLCSSLSRSSRACLLFLSSSAFFFASSSPDLAKFSNLALIFLAPSEPEFEKLPGVKIYYSKSFFLQESKIASYEDLVRSTYVGLLHIGRGSYNLVMVSIQ